jgi:hypothetical protein
MKTVINENDKYSMVLDVNGNILQPPTELIELATTNIKGHIFIGNKDEIFKMY